MATAFSEFRYAYVTAQVLIGKKESFDVTEGLTEFYIVREADFVKPVYALKVQLRKEVMDLINDEKDLWFSVQIHENISMEDDGEDLKKTRDLFLKIYTKPTYEIDDITFLVQGAFECLEDITFALDNSKKSVNLKNIKLTDAVYYHLSKNGTALQLMDSVINKISNTVEYNEIFIPNGTFFDNLLHLDEKYGLFMHSKAKFYFENKVFYMLDWYKDHSYTNNKMHKNYMNIFIRDRESAFENYKGNTTVDTTFTHYAGEYEVEETGKEYKSSGGEKLNMYTEMFFKTPFDQPFETSVKIDENMSTVDIPIKNRVVNKPNPHNPFTASHLINEDKSNVLKVKLLADGTNMTNHNVNTIYNIIFQKETENKYSGKFICERQTIFYKKQPGNKFKCTASLELKSISQTSLGDLIDNFINSLIQDIINSYF